MSIPHHRHVHRALELLQSEVLWACIYDINKCYVQNVMVWIIFLYNKVVNSKWYTHTYITLLKCKDYKKEKWTKGVRNTTSQVTKQNHHTYWWDVLVMHQIIKSLGAEQWWLLMEELLYAVLDLIIQLELFPSWELFFQWFEGVKITSEVWNVC